MLGESKVLYFLFLVLIKGMQSWGEFNISLSNPRGGKMLVRPSASWIVLIRVFRRLNQ